MDANPSGAAICSMNRGPFPAEMRDGNFTTSMRSHEHRTSTTKLPKQERSPPFNARNSVSVVRPAQTHVPQGVKRDAVKGDRSDDRTFLLPTPRCEDASSLVNELDRWIDGSARHLRTISHRRGRRIDRRLAASSGLPSEGFRPPPSAG